MGMVRRLRNNEQTLLTELISETLQATQLLSFLADVRVEEMNDGGMGSLRFYPSDTRPRCFGEQLVEREFIDADGVPVIVAINLDNYGELYELDIWKVDFSPLQRFPVILRGN
jgi:hypothetical protein